MAPKIKHANDLLYHFQLSPGSSLFAGTIYFKLEEQEATYDKETSGLYLLVAITNIILEKILNCGPSFGILGYQQQIHQLCL